LRAKKKDVLNIAAPPPIMSKFIIPKLSGFLSRHSNLDVKFSMDYDNVNYWEHDIDIGIRLSDESDPSMCVTHLSRERYVIAASPTLIKMHQLNLSENIQDAPLIETTPVSDTEQALRWSNVLSQKGLTDCAGGRRLHFGPCLDKAIDAAIASAGVLICPFRLIEHELAARKLSIVLAEALPNKSLEYQAVCMTEKQKNPHIMAFLSWLKTEFSACREDVTPLFSESVA
jgi:DNA-binding transcriptional LysR family regulator